MANLPTLEVVRGWQAECDTIEDELAVVNEQAKTILHKQKQLERTRHQLRSTIAFWNIRRPFKDFVLLPLEIREMIYDRYLERRVFFHSGYASALALVSTQIREEWLNWMSWNQPLDLRRLLLFLFCGRINRSKIPHWDRMPSQMIERVRTVDIEAGTRYFISYRLQVANGELTMLKDHRSAWNNNVSDIHWERVRLVAEIIIGEGGRLKKEHLELSIDALKDDDDITDSQAWLIQALERGEASRKLRTGKRRKKLPASFPGSDAWWLEKWGR